MDVGASVTRLVEWIRARVREAGAVGTCVGISGGVDSAVVAGLCHLAFPDSVLGIIMPCHSVEQDLRDAETVVSRFGIPHITVSLDEAYDSLLSQYRSKAGDLSCRARPPDSRAAAASMAAANMKPRLRMITLYYFANLLNYLVVGTGNRSEITLGYFTKYGDGGVDILPLGNLVKCQVREMARFLGVPDAIIDKPPSAGLWEGQTDEAEMGLTYEEIDRYLLTGHASREAEERIRLMNARTSHKRSVPAVPPADITFNPLV